MRYINLHLHYITLYNTGVWRTDGQTRDDSKDRAYAYKRR